MQALMRRLSLLALLDLAIEFLQGHDKDAYEAAWALRQRVCNWDDKRVCRGGRKAAAHLARLVTGLGKIAG